MPGGPPRRRWLLPAPACWASAECDITSSTPAAAPTPPGAGAGACFDVA
jgi:hypothetical protein